MSNNFSLFETTKNEYVPGVSFNSVSNKWRVRASSGLVARLSFGEYNTKGEASEVATKVQGLRNCTEAYKLRENLGIKGRGAVAKAQKKSIRQTRRRVSNTANEDYVSITIQVPRREISKLMSS